MAVCYFDYDYKNKFNCEYEKKNSGIEVTVEYAIDNEIEPDKNGAIITGDNTKYKKRDILIVDSTFKMNYLLKEANYSGRNELEGPPDSKVTTKFFSGFYFYHEDYSKLKELLKTPKVKKIRIYSNIVNELIGSPSASKEKNEKEYIIRLQKEPERKTVKINYNNVKSLTISDNWKYNLIANEIIIKLDGYIEIEMSRKVKYNEIDKYIYELMTYIQLLRPDKLKISKIIVCVDEIYYGLNLLLKESRYKSSNVENSVSDDILAFLLKCYKLIPYRDSKSEIRNIPYVIFDYSRNIEDTFLMSYKIIECYYKKQNIKGITSSFINYSIHNNYGKSKNMTEDEIEDLARQIICLRNRYVHSGYYIKNNSLKITFKDLDEKISKLKNYTLNNIDVKWIYERTKILYSIAIDIIFKNMLGYEKYKFGRMI